MVKDELIQARQKLCHIKLIEQAREIIENRLKNEKNFVNKDAYNIFVISAFLLVKENLIKKDCLNDILYFDYSNKEYIPYIINLANKIGKNNYIKCGTTVTIQNQPEIDKELEEAIWIVNKIRDSLAHGAYEIIDDKIIITNDHTNEMVPYKLNCTLHIDDLAEFVLSTITKTKIDKDQIFKYISPLLRKKANDEMLHIVSNGRNTQILLDNPENSMQIRSNRIYSSIKSEKDSYSISIRDPKTLRKKIKINPKLINNIEYSIESAKKIIYNANEEENRVIKTTDIISKVSEYFGSSDIDSVIDYIYLYNYMSLVLSFESETKTNLLNLDLTNIDFNINDIDYENMEEKISSIVRTDTTKIKNAWDEYEEHKDVIPIAMVSNRFISFYRKTKEKINGINNIVIRLLRNGIEHGNFKENGKLIKITDKSNQNTKAEKASFIGTVADFYKLTSYIENQKINPIEEVFDIALLQNYIPEEEFENLIDAILPKEDKNKIKTK